MIETLRSLPIESIFKDVLDNPISRSELEKLFPGLENNLTFEGLVNSGLKMFRGLSDKEDYKDLRTVLQNGLGINRDKMFDKDFPYSSIEETYLKLGIELPFNTVNKKHAPKWFNDITDNYLLLDMHGYQEDKIVVKKKKKATFRNTIDDAFHSAFASMCDFYITNDDRSYNKSREVFDKLNLNTRIFKPSEFIDFYKRFLSYNFIEEHISIMYNVLANLEYLQKDDDVETLRSYYFNHFLFDYFTRAHILISKTSTDFQIFLSKDKPTNHKFIFRCEIEELLKKLYSIFGLDSEQKGTFKDEELMEDGNWGGRKWLYNNVTYRLVLYNGWLQLYADLPSE